MRKSVKVAVTGAAGQIGYALLYRIGSGEMFGPDTEIELGLLEIEGALPALAGIRMELDDCAFPLLRCVTTTADPDVAFGDADWAILVGAFPRKAGMERADLLDLNAEIFVLQGQAIGRAARPSCRVLVVGNPCNTNAFICRAASGLPASQVFAMTMLDQNRASAQLAVKAGAPVGDVRNVIVWGNHSPTMFVDFYHATIGGRPAPEVIGDKQWLLGEFMQCIQQRGAAIIKARGSSSAASAANAVIQSVRELTTPTPAGKCYSLCLASDGRYDVPADLVFSFPVRTTRDGIEIVDGIAHGDVALEKLRVTRDELLSERDAVKDKLPSG